MNFTNLKYFVAVAEELNFTRAAKKLYISQQALSNHVAKLEQVVGTPLFDRTPPLSLTAAGHCLFKYGKDILSLKENAEKHIEDIKDKTSGDLRIGATLSRGSILMPLILPKFKKMYPNVKTTLVQGGSTFIEEQLINNEVDVIIGFTPSEQYDIISHLICTEEFLFVIPKTLLEKTYPNDFEKRAEQMAKSFNINLVAKCPIIKLSISSTVSSLLPRIFSKSDTPPNICLDVATVETMVGLCLEGFGAMICPKIFLERPIHPFSQDLHSRLYVYPINLDKQHETISVSHLRHKYSSFAVQEFIRLTKEVIPYRDKSNLLY